MAELSGRAPGPLLSLTGALSLPPSLPALDLSVHSPLPVGSGTFHCLRFALCIFPFRPNVSTFLSYRGVPGKRKNRWILPAPPSIPPKKLQLWVKKLWSLKEHTEKLQYSNRRGPVILKDAFLAGCLPVPTAQRLGLVPC